MASLGVNRGDVLDQPVCRSTRHLFHSDTDDATEVQETIFSKNYLRSVYFKGTRQHTCFTLVPRPFLVARHTIEDEEVITDRSAYQLGYRTVFISPLGVPAVFKLAFYRETFRPSSFYILQDLGRSVYSGVSLSAQPFHLPLSIHGISCLDMTVPSRPHLQGREKELTTGSRYTI